MSIYTTEVKCTLEKFEDKWVDSFNVYYDYLEQLNIKFTTSRAFEILSIQFDCQEDKMLFDLKFTNG